MTFAPSTRRIYDRPVRSAIGLRVEFAPSPTSRPPRMRFVFLGPELCVQLPPRGSSRSYDCCSARGSRHSGPPGDFHPQITSRLAFACRLKAPVMALRAMPGARTKPLRGGVEALRPVRIWRSAAVQGASVQRERCLPGPCVARCVAFRAPQMYRRRRCPCGRTTDHPTAPTAAG